MRASSAHIAYQQPRHAGELTRHLLDTHPATIVRHETATSTATEVNWTRSAADQLDDLETGDDWKRYVPIIGAKPGYIPFTQPERQTVAALTRDLTWLALQCGNGVPSRAATAPDLPPPLPSCVLRPA